MRCATNCAYRGLTMDTIAQNHDQANGLGKIGRKAGFPGAVGLWWGLPDELEYSIIQLSTRARHQRVSWQDIYSGYLLTETRGRLEAWVALYTPRAELNKLRRLHPLRRRVICTLPDWKRNKIYIKRPPYFSTRLDRFLRRVWIQYSFRWNCPRTK